VELNGFACNKPNAASTVLMRVATKFHAVVWLPSVGTKLQRTLFSSRHRLSSALPIAIWHGRTDHRQIIDFKAFEAQLSAG
jgi:hypothetical protein